MLIHGSDGWNSGRRCRRAGILRSRGWYGASFLELAKVLKWPHFGHACSIVNRKRSVRFTEIDGKQKFKSRRRLRWGMKEIIEDVMTHVYPPTCFPLPVHCD